MTQFYDTPGWIKRIWDELQATKARVNAISTGAGQIRQTGGGAERAGVSELHTHLGTGQGGVLASGTGFLHKLAASYEHIQSKLDATVAPGVTDDSAAGYAVGSIWIDVTADKAYFCLDASVGAAVWAGVTEAGGHAAVTLSGAPDYITLSGQDIARALIDLTTHVTGLLPSANIAADIARDSELHDQLHADAHADAGDDELAVQDLASDAATDGQVAKADGAGAVAFEDDIITIPFILDGGGSVITTDIKGDLPIDFACEIQSVTMLADQSGSIVVDIWKDTYANYPPTDADSITASAVPTITSAIKSRDLTLTGWTKTIAAGDILRYNVDSVATIERVTISLHVLKT